MIILYTITVPMAWAREQQEEYVVTTTEVRVNIPTLFLWFNCVFQTTTTSRPWLDRGLVGKQRGCAMRWLLGLDWHTHTHTCLLPLHCVYSGFPSCRAQHGSRVCTAATLAWPRRMCPLLWSPSHQRHEPVCSPKHERHLALCPQPSLTLMRGARERDRVCTCVCV